MNRRVSAAGALVALLAAAGVAFAASARASTTATSSSTSSMAVPVDRQDYVATPTVTNPKDGTQVDVYNDDPSSIHVAVSGGKETAESFVHLAIDYLPPGASATDATMTLYLTAKSDASSSGTFPLYNVNTAQAIVQACALTTELPVNFDPSRAPSYDCQHGSSVGKPNTAETAWTFPLKDLIGYWNAHGNTGAALIAVGSGDPEQSWAVAFYKSRSASSVTYTLPPALPPPVASSHPGPAPAQAPAAGAAATPAAPAAPVASSGPSAAGQATAPAATTPATAISRQPAVASPAVPSASPAANPGPNPFSSPTTTSHAPVWPWVLVGCLLLAAIALGAAHRDTLNLAWKARTLPGLNQLRAHPRAYTVVTVSLVWALVFSTYSLVNPRSTTVRDLASNSESTSTTIPGSQGLGSTATSISGASHASIGARGSGSSGTAGLASAGVGSSQSGTPTGSYTGTSGSTSPSVSNPSANEFSGPGTYRTINGVQVFFPSNGGPPVANLYHGADDTIGITSNQIELCAHAALTYGQAFNISASDLSVYWQWLNDHGGIYGRHIHADYENDNYDPGMAVQAAQACKDLNTFILLGGIGFDQIPAVRQWAEQNHELYYHHVATIEGSAGLRYSFSPLPTVEQMGTLFGQLAVQRFRGQTVGVLYRESSNWQPGSDAFSQVVQGAGMKVISYGVTINQGNYTQQLAQLHAAGATVVFAWENALATTEMIKQAQAQNYHPSWLIFPFNLETQTLGSSSLSQTIMGVAAWDAYDPGYYGGGFAPYADQIHQFENMYKQYDPHAQLSGDGGDLLFLNWEGQKQIADLLSQCGPSCTRNKLAGLLLAGYDRTVPPNCNIDFGRTSDHHHGGYLVNVLQVQADPNGRPNFVPIQRCVTSIGT